MNCKHIILPLDINQNNKKAFSFALDFAHRIKADITILSTYSIAHEYILSANEFENAVNQIKEQIYLRILELKGYFQGQFHQWNKLEEFKIKVLIKEGSIENAMLNVFSQKEDYILCLHENYHSDRRLSEKFISELIDKKIKVFSLPEDTSFYEPVPNLEPKIFGLQKASIFNQMLMRVDIYNLPGDINALRQNNILEDQTRG